MTSDGLRHDVRSSLRWPFLFVHRKGGGPNGTVVKAAARMVHERRMRYTCRVTIIDWNGADLPAELRTLPAGKYVLQRADEMLTADEEQGVIAALESVRAGKGVPHDAARERLLQHVRR
jgi:hypothetical protein